MHVSYAELYARLIPWLCEWTGVDRETVVQVIEGQERFWQRFGDQFCQDCDEEHRG